MDKVQKTFEFSYYTYDDNDLDGEYPVRTELTKKVVFDDFTTWDKVLDQFVLFLGHVYGYDISDKVEYFSFEERIQRLREEGVYDEWKEEAP